jgi:hypothetical protein
MMAIAIPEAAEAVSGGTAAVRGAAAAGRARPKTINATYTSRTQAPPRRAAPRQRGRTRVQPAVNLPSGRRAGRAAARARLPGGRNYQAVILSEFLVAVLVVALAPVAKGGTDTAKAKGSPSPYDTNTLKQLLMIGLVYFILALLSSGQNLGRISAWFGGLVLVAVGVTQTVNGGFAAVLRMFGFNVGSGLGTFPASGDSGSLLPALNLNVGQFSSGALAAGVTQTLPTPDGFATPTQAFTNPSLTTGQTADPTSAFPVIEPGGTQTNSVTTNGLPPSNNLA